MALARNKKTFCDILLVFAVLTALITPTLVNAGHDPDHPHTQTGFNNPAGALDVANPTTGSIPQPNSATQNSVTSPTSNNDRTERTVSPGTAAGNYIGNIIISIASYVTWLGGMLLDTAVDQLVLGFGDLIVNHGVGIAIENGWKIVRDIVNLTFIFGFIWIGMRTILDYDSGWTKRFLSQLVIAALLINFSLFFTRVIVDVSNVLAVEIYESLIGSLERPPQQGGVALAFAEQLNIVSIYNAGTINAARNAGTINQANSPLGQLTTTGNIAFFFGAAIVLIVAGFVFAAGGILIIIRFVVLVFLMMASPLLFAAAVFPVAANTTRTLWRMIFSYSFFVPAYMLLLLMTLQVVDTFPHIKTSDGLFVAFTNQQQSFGGELSAFYVVTYFVVIIIFMILALKISKDISVYGADYSMKLGKKLARGAALGTTGLIGRNTLGRWGQKVHERQEKARRSHRADDRARAGLVRLTGFNALGKKLGSAKYGGSKSAADISKDKKALSREIDRGKQASQLASHVGNLRSGNEAKRIAAEEAITDATVPQLEALSQSQRMKAAAYMSSGQIEGLSKSEKVKDSEVAAVKTARRKAFQKKFETDPKLIASAGKDDLLAVGHEFLSQPEYARYVKASQLEDMEKDRRFASSAVNAVREAREGVLKKLFKDSDTRDSVFKDRNGKERARLPVDILKSDEVVPYLTVNTLQNMVHGNYVGEDDRIYIRANIVRLLPATHPTRAHYLDQPRGSEF